MNHQEIPFSEIYWHPAFQLGGVFMFLLGIIFRSYVFESLFLKKPIEKPEELTDQLTRYIPVHPQFIILHKEKNKRMICFRGNVDRKTIIYQNQIKFFGWKDIANDSCAWWLTKEFAETEYQNL